MKYQPIGNNAVRVENYWQRTIKLIPENEVEINALQNYEAYNATEEEIDLIDNYLLRIIDISKYSPLAAEIMGNSAFKIKYTTF